MPTTAEPAALPEPNLKRAVKLVTELMAIPGKSGEEGAIMRRVVDALRKAGIKKAELVFDNAHQKSPLKGEVGNLILKLPGTRKGPRRVLMAHVDTVPLCVGCKPVRKGDAIVSANPNTALGADDRAGAAVLLNTLLEIREQKLAHPPLTFWWLVQEEVGLHGAQYGALARLGNPQFAFNFDGGNPEKLTVAATGAYRLEIDVRGVASHAGVAPELGVSAIAIASLAVAELHQGGWHGSVDKDGLHGTSNVGVINGGAATNVVTDRVTLRAEARSHDPGFRLRIAEAIEQAFHRAAESVRSAAGVVGSVSITKRMDYESFRLADDEPCVLYAERVQQSLGYSPLRAVSHGGLDANWTTQRGLPTVTMGCGQRSPHTVSEQLNVPDFEKTCRIALRLATGE